MEARKMLRRCFTASRFIGRSDTLLLVEALTMVRLSGWLDAELATLPSSQICSTITPSALDKCYLDLPATPEQLPRQHKDDATLKHNKRPHCQYSI